MAEEEEGSLRPELQAKLNKEVQPERRLDQSNTIKRDPSFCRMIEAPPCAGLCFGKEITPHLLVPNSNPLIKPVNGAPSLSGWDKATMKRSPSKNSDRLQELGGDWKQKLDSLCRTFHELESSVSGEAISKFQDALKELDSVRNFVSHESDSVDERKNFLLDLKEDEEIDPDEREVADWLTSSFMNTNGSRPTAWAADIDDVPMSPLVMLRGKSAPKWAKQAQMSTLNLGDGDNDQDGSDIDEPYAQYCFYRSQNSVNKVLEGLGSWEFDIFEVEDMVGDLMLPLLGVTICKKLKAHNLNNFHDIPEKLIFDYLLSVTNAYYPRAEVSYHNALHAADTMCSSYALLKSKKFETFSFLQIVSLIVAAAAHDVNHNGYNNLFHINSSSKLALKYNDRSVLENHHCSVGWKLAMQPEHSLVKAIPRDQIAEFRKIFINSILATDMHFHGQQLKMLADLHGKEQITDPGDQMKLLGHVLHGADISNVSKPFHYANTWVMLVMEEFFKQGDKEKDLKMPVSPLCDRVKTDIDASEVGFIKFIVKPWFESLAKVIPVRCQDALEHLNLNFKTFNERAVEKHKQKSENVRRSFRSVLLKNESSTSDTSAVSHQGDSKSV